MLFNINIVFKKIDSFKICFHSHICALQRYKYNSPVLTSRVLFTYVYFSVYFTFNYLIFTLIFNPKLFKGCFHPVSVFVDLIG